MLLSLKGYQKTQQVTPQKRCYYLQQHTKNAHSHSNSSYIPANEIESEIKQVSVQFSLTKTYRTARKPKILKMHCCIHTIMNSKSACIMFKLHCKLASSDPRLATTLNNAVYASFVS